MAPKKKEADKGGYSLELRFGRTKANLKMGVVGLPNVGKSSFFNLMTKQHIDAANFPFCTINPNEGRVQLPDDRFTDLCKRYKPKSEVPAYLNITDIAGLVKGASEGEGLGNAFLSHIQAVDGIYHMVRLFENDEVTHVDDSVDPVRDLETITSELALKDRAYVNSVREQEETKLKKANNKKMEENLVKLFDRVQELLDKNQILSKQEWTAYEVEKINELMPRLITTKPVVYLLNMSEKSYVTKKSKWLKKVFDWINAHGGGTIIPYSVELEERLAEAQEQGDTAALEEIEKEGGKSNLEKIIKTGFNELNLINFLTCGEDEVRAWTVYKGATAPNCAGAIHSDMERCFIKAEVVSYADFVEHTPNDGKKASMAGVKAAGKYRQEGKTYVVNDGDIINIMHNAKK